MRRTVIPYAVVLGIMSPGLSATELIIHDPLAEEYGRRAMEIAAEIVEGSAAPWAGEYHLGDGMGANVTLVIAPDHGFAAVSTGCVGVYGQSFGSVTQLGDRLLLIDEMANQAGMFGYFSGVLVPVRWGEDSYLVGEDQMGEFELAINAEVQECPDLCGRFLMRGGWDRMAERMAARYEREYPAAPLYVRVTRVIKPDLEAVDGDFRWRNATVELDTGRDGGVWEGMEFFSSTAGWITDIITVDTVNDSNAIATVSAYNQLPIPVHTGTCVSNYYDDSIEKRIDGRPQEGCDDGVPAEY